jgi:DNA-binding beta-propeller fold protein YncE
MWVANSGSSNVTELSPSGAVLGTFAVGTRPEGIAAARTTNTIWVANSGSNNVTELSGT